MCTLTNDRMTQFSMQRSVKNVFDNVELSTANCTNIKKKQPEWSHLNNFQPFLSFLFSPLLSTEVPGGPPQIHNIRAKYKLGEIIRGNCTSRYSRPAANLTWTINDIPVSNVILFLPHFHIVPSWSRSTNYHINLIMVSHKSSGAVANGRWQMESSFMFKEAWNLWTHHSFSFVVVIFFAAFSSRAQDDWHHYSTSSDNMNGHENEHSQKKKSAKSLLFMKVTSEEWKKMEKEKGIKWRKIIHGMRPNQVKWTNRNKMFHSWNIQHVKMEKLTIW